MRYLVMALVAIGGLAVAGATPVAARDYSFCFRGDTTGGTYDCSYTSFQQCQATASGLHGYCTESPFLAQAYVEEPYPARRRHRRYH